MKRILIILITTIGLFNVANADTISYWHVYYNDIRIKEFNDFSKAEIVLNVRDIKPNDSLTIMYFRDTPCQDCATEILIKNGHIIITKGKGEGTFHPIKISVFDLLQYHLKVKKGIYDVFYCEKCISSQIGEKFLFSIKLE